MMRQPNDANMVSRLRGDLTPLLAPRSVAVIGASEREGNLGGVCVRHFRKFGFAGAVWPVNPSGKPVAGLPCFASLADLLTNVADDFQVFRPGAEMPPALREHLRYPEAMFKLQADIYQRYHITDARAFFIGEDAWNIPLQPTSSQRQPVEPWVETVWRRAGVISLVLGVR